MTIEDPTEAEKRLIAAAATGEWAIGALVQRRGMETGNHISGV